MATHRGKVAHHEVSSEGGVKEESKSPLERPTIGCGEEPLSRIWQESSKVVLYNSLQYSTEQSTWTGREPVHVIARALWNVCNCEG